MKLGLTFIGLLNVMESPLKLKEKYAIAISAV
jgi:hypothetical protein